MPYTRFDNISVLDTYTLRVARRAHRRRRDGQPSSEDPLELYDPRRQAGDRDLVDDAKSEFALEFFDTFVAFCLAIAVGVVAYWLGLSSGWISGLGFAGVALYLVRVVKRRIEED